MSNRTIPKFIPSIHHFRGVAILIIVLGHSVTNEFYSDHPVLPNLFKGGTTIFFFISGFLFYHLLNDKFKYVEFLTKKFRFVILPYLICSCPILIYNFLTGHRISAFPNASSLETLFISLAVGRHMLAYWFIPFIAVVFLTIPVSVLFSQKNKITQIVILLVLSCISLCIHRPTDSINPIHSFIYYIPVYLFGIFVRSNWIEFTAWLARGWYYVGLIIAILLALLQFYFDGNIGGYNKTFDSILTFSGLDLMFLQKIALTIFLLGAFEKSNSSNKLLSLMADYSFPIFFIHGYAKWILIRLLKLEDHLFNWLENSLAISTIMFILIMLISIATTYVAKKALGKNSRFFIGG